MSGRLNPRKYDLGELRDAVRESSRRRGGRGASPGSTRGDGRQDESSDEDDRPASSGSRRPASSAERDRDRGRDLDRYPKRVAGDFSNRTTDTGVSGEHRSTEAVVSPRDLELLARFSRRGLDRPYLDRLPDEYSAQLEIFEWLECLVATAGRDAALDALEYYESIGWLSERSHDQLVEFLEGLPSDDASETRPLSIDDHRGSLLYVARLAQRLY